MIEVDENGTQMKICIPIRTIDSLRWYEEGIKGLLRRIEISKCDEELKENIKAVYELLNHLKKGGEFFMETNKRKTTKKKRD